MRFLLLSWVLTGLVCFVCFDYGLLLSFVDVGLAVAGFVLPFDWFCWLICSFVCFDCLIDFGCLLLAFVGCLLVVCFFGFVV